MYIEAHKGQSRSSACTPFSFVRYDNHTRAIMARFAQVFVSLAFALPRLVECAPVVDLQQRSVHVRLALTERKVNLGYDHVMSM